MPQHKHDLVHFTPEVARVVLQRLANGESLLRICGPDREPGLPDRHTVYEHMHRDKEFRRRYLLAREAQAELLADEVLEIADGLNVMPGEERNVSWAWLRVSARQWRAGVMAPRTFGKRGVFRDELAEWEIQSERVNKMSSMERAARIAALLETARRRRDGEEEEEEEEPEITGDGA